MISTAEFKNGRTIEVDGVKYSIVDFQHVKPGKGGAFVRTKLKNVLTGAVVDRTFRAGEKVEDVHMEKRPYNFLYKDGEDFVFMDEESYEQINVGSEMVGDARKYLVENSTCYIMLLEGKPAAVEPPTFVELKVVETDPGVRGDTAQGGSKPATLEGGAVVNVPLFIEVGEVLKVDTRTDDYVTRVS